MAKPRNPKKASVAKEPIPTTTSPVFTTKAPAPNPSVDATIAAANSSVQPSAEELTQTAKPAETATTETKQTAVKSPKAPRKEKGPEIVKAEPRTNLVPINVEEEIRRFAYLLAERRGFAPGHEADDWIAAEREVRQRYHQQSA